MGGDLTLDTEPGRGCVFTLWLPAPSQAPASPRRSETFAETAVDTTQAMS